MSSKVIVTWASVSDKMDNSEFIAERGEKMHQMHSSGKTNGYVINPISSPRAVLTFNTQTDAEEWKTFIEALAIKYNKTIESIVIE